MRNRLAISLLALLATPLAVSAQPGTLPAVTLTPPPNAPWYDTALPVEQRAAALVSQMTLEEKASQLVNRANAIPRLGVPAYNWWSEALHGAVIRSHATVFPEPVGLAATFDPALVHEMGTVISTEARVEYNMELRQNRPGFLVAQHQHLSRSALGPRPGNLWRGSVPHRAIRRCVRHRPARRRSRPSEGDRHAQAFRGPFGARADPPCRRRDREPA